MKFRRDLDAEMAKFFKGTPDERVRRALRLGRRSVDVFMASLPAGTPRSVAAEMLRDRTRRIVRKLEEMGAPCALIGGVALAFHGIDRATRSWTRPTSSS